MQVEDAYVETSISNQTYIQKHHTTGVNSWRDLTSDTGMPDVNSWRDLTSDTGMPDVNSWRDLTSDTGMLDVNSCLSSTELVILCMNICVTEQPPPPRCRYPLPPNVSILAAIWCLLIGIFGASGNLLTILAIPWASKRKLVGLDRSWNTTTVFLINLAVADLMYCVVNLPMYSVQYLALVWPLGHTTCRLQAAFRYINAFADWMSLGLVAFSRCLSLTKPKLCDALFGGNGCYLAIVITWIYSILLVLPSLLGIYGQIGYNVRLGKCDFVPTSSVSKPDMLLYGIGFFVPCLIITISYTIILGVTKKSTSIVRKYSRESETKMKRKSSDGSKKSSFSHVAQLRNRDLKLTWTVLTICAAYILCVAPMTILVLTGLITEHPILELGFHCIYWFQYSINFIIYAARSDQFRAAYSSYLKHLQIICCRQDRSARQLGRHNPNRISKPVIMRRCESLESQCRPKNSQMLQNLEEMKWVKPVLSRPLNPSLMLTLVESEELTNTRGRNDVINGTKNLNSQQNNVINGVKSKQSRKNGIVNEQCWIDTRQFNPRCRTVTL